MEESELARPVSGGDSVEKAFRMILADDRRQLPPEEEAAAKALWRRVFRATPEKTILRAVQTWLEENPKGRPNVGKILTLVRELSPGVEGGGRRSDDDDRAGELRWATNLLERCARDSEFQGRMEHPNYRHSLESAERALRRRGLSTWQEARARLEPGWTPATTTESIP